MEKLDSMLVHLPVALIWCSAFFKISGGAKTAILSRFIDDDISPFTEQSFFPIQHATACSMMLGLCFHAKVASSRCDPKKKGGVNTQAKINGHGSHIVYIGHVPHVITDTVH